MRQIIISMPDEVADLEWLQEQINLLRAGLSYIEEYDCVAKGYAVPGAVLMVNDEIPDDTGMGYFNVVKRVMFHSNGTAFVDPCPGGPDNETAYGDLRHMEGYQDRWPKVSWGEGLLTLVQSVVSRIKLPDAERADRVSQAIKQLTEAVGDARAESPSVEVIESN